MKREIVLVVDDDFFKRIVDNLSFLGYESLEEFCHDAIALRTEVLLQSVLSSRSSHGSQIQQTAVCSSK